MLYFQIYWFNCCKQIWELVWPNSLIDVVIFAIRYIMIRLWLFYIFYQSSSATADGQITFLCQELCCFVQYCFDVLDSIFGAKKEIQIMCDQLRFVRHFHEMRHLVFFFVEDNNQMCNIRKRNSTLSDLGHQLYFCWRTILPPYVAQIILDNWLAFLQNSWWSLW